MTAPHLRTRPCDGLWRCATCAREAARTHVIHSDDLPPWLLVLCEGCSRGFDRALSDGWDHRDVRGTTP